MFSARSESLRRATRGLVRADTDTDTETCAVHTDRYIGIYIDICRQS